MVMVGDRLYSFSVKGFDVQVQQADVVVFLDSFSRCLSRPAGTWIDDRPNACARRTKSGLAGNGLRRVVRNENICSMHDRGSNQPRDEAIRAAMRDARVLAGILEGEFQATPGPVGVRRVLTEIIAGFGRCARGRVDRHGGDLPGRQIRIRFQRLATARQRARAPHATCRQAGRQRTAEVLRPLGAPFPTLA